MILQNSSKKERFPIMEKPAEEHLKYFYYLLSLMRISDRETLRFLSELNLYRKSRVQVSAD
jgi:hypothetical protein